MPVEVFKPSLLRLILFRYSIMVLSFAYFAYKEFAPEWYILLGVFFIILVSFNAVNKIEISNNTVNFHYMFRVQAFDRADIKSAKRTNISREEIKLFFANGTCKELIEKGIFSKEDTTKILSLLNSKYTKA